MLEDQPEAQYQRALEQLSRLVRERDQCLLQLDTIASLPLSISPRSGHVAEFSVRDARELLDSIEQQTVWIHQAIEEANRHADTCGRPRLAWLRMPRSNGGSAEGEV